MICQRKSGDFVFVSTTHGPPAETIQVADYHHYGQTRAGPGAV